MDGSSPVDRSATVNRVSRDGRRTVFGRVLRFASMILRILAALVILVLLAFGGLIVATGSPTAAITVAVVDTIGRPVSPAATPVHLVIRPGETASNVGDKLAASGIIRSSLAFRMIVRLQGLGSNIEAGDYE